MSSLNNKKSNFNSCCVSTIISYNFWKDSAIIIYNDLFNDNIPSDVINYSPFCPICGSVLDLSCINKKGISNE